jgi:hypothetical protein
MQQCHVARCASGRAQFRAALIACMHRRQARRGVLGGAAQGAAAAARAPDVPLRPRLRVLQPPERLAALLLQCIQARALRLGCWRAVPHPSALPCVQVCARRGRAAGARGGRAATQGRALLGGHVGACAEQ